MKEETSYISNQQLNAYVDEARVLRSQEVSRLVRQILRAPIRMVSRFSTFKIESARTAVENR